MLRVTIIAALLILISGCVSSDHSAGSNTAAQAENERLNTEAAALRKAVVEQKARLETLNQR